MVNTNDIGYKDEKENYITNFKIIDVRLVTFYSKDKQPIDSYHVTLNIEGNETFTVKLYQNDYIERMKKEGCLCLIKNKLKFQQFFSNKIKDFSQSNQIEKKDRLYVFENLGWNYILDKDNKKKYYYTFSDCSIGKKGIERNVISAKDNHCLNYYNNSFELSLFKILSLINKNFSLFYPGIISTILSLSIDILMQCNYIHLPIIWITGRTGCGKSTLVKDTFFLTERNDRTQNFHLSLQSKKSFFYDDIRDVFDSIIVYDDIRKTKSANSNQKIATILEEIVRQNSESPDKRNNIFVVTGESNTLSEQSLSFKNRCLEFSIKDDIIRDHYKILDLINEKKLMKPFWISIICFLIQQKENLVKDCIGMEKEWKKQYIESFDPRVVKIGFCEHFSALIFENFLKSLKIEDEDIISLENWKNFSFKSCQERMKMTQFLYYGHADIFIFIFKKMILSKRWCLFSASTSKNSYNIDGLSFIIPKGEEEDFPIIGTYFQYGIEPYVYEQQDHYKQPFLLLNINKVIELCNQYLNEQCNYNNGIKIFFERYSLQKELQKKRILYVHRRSTEKLKNQKESESYNYAINFTTGYYNYNFFEDINIPCWIINVNCLEIPSEFFINNTKNILDVFEDSPYYNDNDYEDYSYDNNKKAEVKSHQYIKPFHWTSKIKPFLSDPINFIEL